MPVLDLPNPFWVLLLGLLLLCIPPSHTAKCPQQCICDQIQLKVACVNKNLTQVPSTVDEITVKLDLRGSDIQELPSGAFKHTPYLTHLWLPRCNIRRVKEGAFRGLGRLVFLNLAYNNIEILYQESFDGLSSLKELFIDHNRVEEIKPGAFSQLGFLNLLSVTHNQLVYMPHLAFQGLQNIKWLRLSHNSLNYLDTEAFAGLFTLNRLSLDHNELQFFPTETMTRELRQSSKGDTRHYNPMTYLGENAVSMAKLTHLFLDHMSLQDLVNTAVSKSPNLVHLDISHNQLRVLQPFSEGSPKLARLSLAGNPINCNCYLRPLREWAIYRKVKLLGTCGGPAHLSGESLEAVYPKELRCQSQEAMLKAEFEEATRITPPPTQEPENKIKCPANCVCEAETHHSSCENRGHTKVPRGFSPETRLLDMRGNNFHYIPSNSFPGVAQVVSLHLQRCKIVDVEVGAFSGMKGLIYLYLSENDLTSLSPEAFKGASGLEKLYLGGNKLKEVPTEALSKARNIEDLRLSGNLIRWVGPNAFKPLDGSLKDLYLDKMRLEKVSFSPKELNQVHKNRCPISINLHPWKWIEKVNLKVRATCANPPEVKGRKVKDVYVFKACSGGESLPHKATGTEKEHKRLCRAPVSVICRHGRRRARACANQKLR
uniref:LRRNT domain-containing protein n=1 Tax=Xiphophorus couchianus TaxID=32473 RepID=A0A3B5KP51_9TELE